MLFEMNVVFLQLLKCIAVDVETRGHLGKCIALRTAEILQLVQQAAGITMSKAALEAQLVSTEKARRSQQKFLHPKSNDEDVHASSKGVGGNTTNQRCIILQQTTIDQEHLNTIREGMLFIMHSNRKYEHAC